MVDREPTDQPPGRIIVEQPDDTVRLMQLVPDDDQPYFDLIAFDPDHLRQNGDVTADNYPTVEAVRESIVHPRNPDKYRFGIWDGDVMVGSDNVRVDDGGETAELGSWIGKKYIGNGYAGRGRRLLLDFAFQNLGVGLVYSDVVVGNKESRRSMEKSGFMLAGIVTDDKGVEMWMFTFSRKQYEELQKQ